MIFRLQEAPWGGAVVGRSPKTTHLLIPWETSYVHALGLLRRPVGGGYRHIPSTLCGSPTCCRVQQVHLSRPFPPPCSQGGTAFSASEEYVSCPLRQDRTGDNFPISRVAPSTVFALFLPGTLRERPRPPHGHWRPSRPAAPACWPRALRATLPAHALPAAPAASGCTTGGAVAPERLKFLYPPL